MHGSLGVITFMIGFGVGAVIFSWLAWSYGRGLAQEQCILEILAESETPLYGLDLVMRSNGLLKRGTVYVLLGRMQDRGLIRATRPDNCGRRRYYLASV